MAKGLCELVGWETTENVGKNCVGYVRWVGSNWESNQAMYVVKTVGWETIG